jgi:hypothetical protein
VEYESKNDNSNNSGDLHLSKITQKIPQQHNKKARNEGTTKDSHIGHCTRIAESANVKVQNIFLGRSNITCSKGFKHRTAATI